MGLSADDGSGTVIGAFHHAVGELGEIAKAAKSHSRSLTFPSPLEVLAFLTSWPGLEKAASLTLARAAKLDGDHCEILTPAAEKLFGKRPFAETPLLRAMIDFALREARRRCASIST